MIWAPPGHAEQEANAHLISAAPDLLEACEEALADLTKLQVYGPGRKKIEAAIAKARGQA